MKNPNEKVIFDMNLLHYIMRFAPIPDRCQSSPIGILIKDALSISSKEANTRDMYNPIVYDKLIMDDIRRVIFWRDRVTMPMDIYIWTCRWNYLNV
jgi:hypothetical protein